MRSDLQKLSTQVIHARFRALQLFSTSQTRRLKTSVRTKELIIERNYITKILQKSIKYDYEVQKKQILAERASKAKLDQKRN